MEPLTLARRKIPRNELLTSVGASFLVHIVVFASAFIAVWTMPHKPIKPPFCTVNLVSLKDIGTGNAEPKGVPKGSEDIKVPEAPKSYARTAEKSGPALPVKRLHLDDAPKRQEVPIKKIEPKEAPKLAESPQSLAAIEKNLDKLIVKPKVVPRSSSAAADPAPQAAATAAREPAASKPGKAAATTESAPRGSPTGSTDAGAKGATQGSTAGSPEGSTAMNALAGMYVERVKDAVEREWNLVNDKSLTGLKAVVEVQIRKSGEIISIQVVKPSGNSIFDESAVRAVRKATLPPVPEVLVQSNPKLVLTFLPGRVS